MTMNKLKQDTSRRRFLRHLSFVTAGAAIAGCRRTSVTLAEELSERTMTMRVNPNTGDSVSILGYGCMRLPTIGLANGTDDDTIDQEAVNRSVDEALAGGVNYFDTSPAYCQGMSESAIGTALSRHPRNSYYIATKLSNFAPSTWSRETSEEMFRNSLKNLRTDYVDYLLLHAIGQGGMEAFNKRYVNNGILDYLIARRKDGTIRNLGFSYHGDIAVFDHLLHLMDESKVHWDFAQIQMNYIDWKHAKEVNPRNTDASYLYGQLHSRGIPTVIMEPLLGGRLAKVPQAIANKMLSRRPDDSPAAWAFRFAGTPEGILTVLSGMTYIEHLRENMATYSPLQALDEDEKAFLERCALELLHNDTVPCTACNYCMPCPYGVDIPGIFAHYNKCINDGMVPRDNADPDYERERRAFLYGYDRTIPRLRQVSHCIACGGCRKHCPQDIDIPARLAEIDTYIEKLKTRI